MMISELRIRTFHVLMPLLESQAFIEDANAYDNAMKLFQQTVPSIVYLESDGNLPHATRGRSEQIQATYRDLTHTGYSISSISHILKTSRIQGLDQYGGDLGTRLRFSFGFHAQFE
ncbi:hypothetical protein F5882DRAFT_468293 [Hyaloscypha sp. PMI_1271]|nr:hypothetical protein F5882DRAFT_468293 [Hyaloscypha sp. PMI_1271]